jgi:hypothetical protein
LQGKSGVILKIAVETNITKLLTPVKSPGKNTGALQLKDKICLISGPFLYL